MTFHDQLDPPDVQFPGDALPDPEPAVPSLPEPDPGVFHHDPARLPAEPTEEPAA